MDIFFLCSDCLCHPADVPAGISKRDDRTALAEVIDAVDPDAAAVVRDEDLFTPRGAPPCGMVCATKKSRSMWSIVQSYCSTSSRSKASIRSGGSTVFLQRKKSLRYWRRKRTKATGTQTPEVQRSALVEIDTIPVRVMMTMKSGR